MNPNIMHSENLKFTEIERASDVTSDQRFDATIIDSLYKKTNKNKNPKSFLNKIYGRTPATSCSDPFPENTTRSLSVASSVMCR